MDAFMSIALATTFHRCALTHNRPHDDKTAGCLYTQPPLTDYANV
jgi:hypothetical protein